jgi:hypothetical protein
MPPNESNREDSGSLRVHDRLSVELTPLNGDMVTAVREGRLGASIAGGGREAQSLEGSVDQILRSLPPDQRPEGPMAESLRLVDAKLDYLMGMLEELQTRGEGEAPAPRDVAMGLDGMDLWLTEEPVPGRGDWLWLRIYLPGRPRTLFEVPGEVTEVSAGDGGIRVGLAFRNVTGAEERVLSRYIFRRHRQEVRQHRTSEGD